MKHWVLVLSLALSATLQAATLIVNQNTGPYFTIQQGVNATGIGDTVLVMPAIYLEAVTIPRRIVLMGVDRNTCIIQSSVDAVYCQTGSDSATIANLTLRAANTYAGVSVPNVNAANPRIQWNIIENCGRGVLVNNRYAIVQNNVIRTCGTGIYLTGDGADALLHNNVIVGCTSDGVMLIGEDPDPVCYGNIIVSCATAFGRSCCQTSIGVFSYNNLWQNALNWEGSIPEGPGNTYVDPLFVNQAAGDYHLMPSSPCVDTGMPGGAFPYPDLNGTRNDMGVYGGAYQMGGAGPAVTSITVTPSSVPQGGTISITATGTVQ